MTVVIPNWRGRCRRRVPTDQRPMNIPDEQRRLHVPPNSCAYPTKDSADSPPRQIQPLRRTDWPTGRAVARRQRLGHGRAAMPRRPHAPACPRSSAPDLQKRPRPQRKAVFAALRDGDFINRDLVQRLYRAGRLAHGRAEVVVKSCRLTRCGTGAHRPVSSGFSTCQTLAAIMGDGRAPGDQPEQIAPFQRRETGVEIVIDTRRSKGRRRGGFQVPVQRLGQAEGSQSRARSAWAT